MGQQLLHVVLLPFMAHGHMIPMLDMAKLFTSRGLRTTIITTPAFADPIRRAQQMGRDIGLSIIQFPPEGSSLPDHVVSVNQLGTPDLIPKFVNALSMLQEPVEKLLQELKPNCLVSDMFFPWTAESAAKFGIPRLVFHGTSYLALCATEQMHLHKPFKNVSSDSEPFVLPNLAHGLEFTRAQVSMYELMEEENLDDFGKLLYQAMESVGRSYGVIMNTFYELEPAYADHYREVEGKKAWHVGPFLLCNNTFGEKALRGEKSDIDEHECLAWLDSKKPHSVVYLCFGSGTTFSPAQLHETAIGLESSGQAFVWVLKNGRNEQENEDWMPQGFEERTKEKGLIIRGWAPQAMIIDHPAIGAFVTHCGWNSMLEGLCAGIPMITWPAFAEQFFNEKLVTDIIRTGVSVGNKKWQMGPSEGVPRDAVEKAVRRVMVGEDVEEMRSRAKHYKEMAMMAVEEGGSSYRCLSALIDELSAYSTSPPNPMQNTD